MSAIRDFLNSQSWRGAGLDEIPARALYNWMQSTGTPASAVESEVGWPAGAIETLFLQYDIGQASYPILPANGGGFLDSMGGLSPVQMLGIGAAVLGALFFLNPKRGGGGNRRRVRRARK
jgi:hypothetical protein